MAFDERIRIIVESVGTGKAAGEIRNLERQMASSGRASDGWRGQLGKVGTFVGNNLPSLVAGGAAAIGAFAVKSVGAFQDVALSAGKLSDSTGLAIEDASRWNEVAGDLGVSNEKLSGTFGFLLKSIGKNPEAFRDLGITAQDSNGQILQAIDVLNLVPEGAERAALGAKLFGRSWAEISELIGKGSAEIKKSLGEVSDAKVINEAELAKARKMRDTMDKLSDVVGDATLVFGQFIVEGIGPTIAAVAELGGQLNDLFTGLGGMGGAVSKYLDVAPIVGGIDNLSVALDGSADNIDRAKAAASTFVPILDAIPFFETETAAQKAAKAQEKQAETMRSQSDFARAAAEHLDVYNQVAEENATASEKAAAGAKRLREEMDKQVEVATDAISGARDLADVNRELVDDRANLNKTMAEANKVGGTNIELNREATDAAIRNADSLVAQYEAQTRASGGIVDATRKLDTQNEAMLSAAATATGPLRGSILSYIGTVNQIPPEKLTEIQAAIDRGDIATANALLAEASRTRQATIRVAANLSSFWDDVNAARSAAARTITIPVRGTSRRAFAEGGLHTGPTFGLFGENPSTAPEVTLNSRQAARVLWNLAHAPAAVPQAAAPPARGGDGAAINIGTVVLPNVTDGPSLVAELERFAQRSGRARLHRLVNG